MFRVNRLIVFICLLFLNGCKNPIKRFDLPKDGSRSPLTNQILFDNPESTLANWWRENRLENPEQAERLKKLLSVPSAMWVNDGKETTLNEIKNIIKISSEERKIPIFCIYNIVGRDINQYSKGGAVDESDYCDFIIRINRKFGTGAAILILEPDSLGQLSLLSKEQQEERLRLLQGAVKVLGKAPRRYIYLDGGNSGWQSPEVQARLLRLAGVKGVRGFAINVSNFQTLQDSVAYAIALSRLTGGKSAVIDTSRCGNGPALDKRWCNPPGRALGPRPATKTHAPIDALLWVKPFAESDGNLDGAPSAGAIYPDYAIELLRNAGE